MKNAILNSDGLLYITGPGNKEKYLSTEDLPWKEQRNCIKAVEFAEGVKIRSLMNWFWGCKNLTEVKNWPEGVEDIAAAFCGCQSLAQLPKLPVTLRDMDEAFIDCISLSNVSVIPKNVIYTCDAFVRCRKLSGRMNLQGNITQYAYMFQDAASEGTGLTLDYKEACAASIDGIIATGTDNIIKGICL